MSEEHINEYLRMINHAHIGKTIELSLITRSMLETARLCLVSINAIEPLNGGFFGTCLCNNVCDFSSTRRTGVNIESKSIKTKKKHGKMNGLRKLPFI